METAQEWIPFTVGNIPVFVFIGWVFFRDWGNFMDSFLGFLENEWAERFKFGWFIMACLLTATFETIPITWLAEGEEFHHEKGRGEADAGMASAPEGSPGGGRGRVT